MRGAKGEAVLVVLRTLSDEAECGRMQARP